VLVIRLSPPALGMPDYYELYERWWSRASMTGDNRDLQEAYRFARLAEEFGQAIIKDDETHGDF
jgi:hypothetical protein